MVAKVTPEALGCPMGRVVDELPFTGSSGAATTTDLSSFGLVLSARCTTVDCEDVDEAEDDIDEDETAEGIEIEDEQAGGSSTLLLLLVVVLANLSTDIDEDGCLAGAAPPPPPNEVRCCRTSTCKGDPAGNIALLCSPMPSSR